MKKLKLDPESLVVEVFETSDNPSAALSISGPPCWQTFETTGGPWLCAVDCGSVDGTCGI